jgi:alpha-amylase
VLNHKAGADEKEEFLATMVDRNNRTKTVGDMHNIEGWTK